MYIVWELFFKCNKSQLCLNQFISNYVGYLPFLSVKCKFLLMCLLFFYFGLLHHLYRSVHAIVEFLGGMQFCDNFCFCYARMLLIFMDTFWLIFISVLIFIILMLVMGNWFY